MATPRSRIQFPSSLPSTTALPQPLSESLTEWTYFLPSKQEYRQYSERSKLLKNLKHKSLVQIFKIEEDSTSISIFTKDIVFGRIWNCKCFTKTVIEQMADLATYFIKIGVKTGLSANKISFSQPSFLKFFVGLDFQWIPTSDRAHLQNYYKQQIEELFSHKKLQSAPKTSRYSLVPRQSSFQKGAGICSTKRESEESSSKRIGRFTKINEDFKMRKPAGDRFLQMKNLRQFLSPQSRKKPFTSHFTSSLALNKQPKHEKPTNPPQNRSSKQLLTNEYWKKIQTIQNETSFQIGKSLLDVPLSKSIETQESSKKNDRLEKMKQRQYEQIKNSNKIYLKDFISVLQNEEQCESQATPLKPFVELQLDKSFQFSTRMDEMTVNLTNRDTSIEDLRLRAQESISNSLKAIKYFKATC